MDLKCTILWRYKRRQETNAAQDCHSMCLEGTGWEPAWPELICQAGGDRVRLCQAGGGKAILNSWRLKRLSKRGAKKVGGGTVV